MMWSQINQRINQALNSIRMAFRAQLNAANSEGKVQTMQGEGLSGESLQGQEIFQHYGFTSHPYPARKPSFCRWAGVPLMVS